jgi:putative FmdB family regulatory protein
MPIYEYECQKCGTFEATQRITENPLSKCPTCKGKVKKLISNTSFQLKGTGWYITDYARKGKDASKENGSSSSSSESKSETKEAKSETKESKTDTKKESTPSKTASSSSTPSSTT